MLKNENRQLNIFIFRTISLAQRILRRVQTRSVDCCADDKPEGLRAQEAPAIVKQNSRQRNGTQRNMCAYFVPKYAMHVLLQTFGLYRPQDDD